MVRCRRHLYLQPQAFVSFLGDENLRLAVRPSLLHVRVSLCLLLLNVCFRLCSVLDLLVRGQFVHQLRQEGDVVPDVRQMVQQ